MNRKEVSEIKKNISVNNDLFVVNNVVVAFVDAEKQIKCKTNRSFTEIPDEELECILDTVTAGLSGTLGKGLVEYEFPKEAYEDGKQHEIIYNAYKSKLKDEEAVDKLLEHIVSNLTYSSTYAIYITHSSYTVFKKTKADEEDPYNNFDFSFMNVCLCPVEIRIDGLIYDEEENAIVKKHDFDRIVSPKPQDAFMYPTFTGRGPDVNHVLCYTKNVKKPNISVVEEILGCQFTSTAVDQKIAFHDIIEAVAGENLDYQFLSNVNEKIRDIVDSTKNDFDIPTLNEDDVCNILIDSGVEEEKEESIRSAYKTVVGEENLPAVNLLENKMQLAADGITINVGKNAISKVRTRNEDGRRYLLIDLDDPTIKINGIDSKV